MGKIAFKCIPYLIKSFFATYKRRLLENNRKGFLPSCGNANVRFSYGTRGEESTLTKRYRITAITLPYISTLLHNAICCGEKLLLLEVIALDIKKPLSLLIVMFTFKPLSLLKFIAVTARQKR